MICAIESCGRRLYAKGMCRAHYARSWRETNMTKPIRGDMSAGDRFWEKVSIPSDVLTGCWLWVGGKAGDGYGRFCAGKPNGAHRFAWEAFSGPIPPGLCVLHRCDNRPCVNPTHLFLGTNLDNIADKVAKGRQVRGQRMSDLVRPRAVRGEAHPGAKLTTQKVLEMRALYADGVPHREIARRFGVSPTGARSALSGRTWPDAGTKP